MRLVHAVIVHHRGQEMLRVCLETLLDCRGVQLEIVLVANGGDDVLPEITEEDSKLHALRLHVGVGFAEANNRGVA
jgi:GT2 family glycosyltransferase